MKANSPDPERPTIKLHGDNTLHLADGDMYIEAGASCTDALGNDITHSSLRIDEPRALAAGKSLNNGGLYRVKYTCADTHGHLAQPVYRMVSVPSEHTIGNSLLIVY
jgi:hypothetical protein